MDHDPRIERALRTWITWGALAVLLIPAARMNTTWLGWLPLWLVAMPAVAWWALHRFALPHWSNDGQATAHPGPGPATSRPGGRRQVLRRRVP